MKKHPLDLDELISEGIISREVADQITQFYQNKSKGSGAKSKLIIAFGIVGALLVGLGILLIIAHNWDQMSRLLKTVIGFIPLLIGQLITGFVLIKKNESVAWGEGSSIFLFASIGVTISVISQVYNIPGSLASYVLTWMILGWPLIYLLHSSMASIFYLIGITYFACETGYWNESELSPHYFWLLFLAAVPHYYYLVRQKPKSNFTLFHHWVIPLALVCTLGIVGDQAPVYLFVAYLSLFGCFILASSKIVTDHRSFLKNGFRTIGTLGTFGVLLFLSFRWFWDDLGEAFLPIRSLEFLVACLLTFGGIVLLVWKTKSRGIRSIHHLHVLFLAFACIFCIGLLSTLLGMILTNIIILISAVLTIREGAHKEDLGILNFGLLTIAALIACRFFDTNISFVWRGTVFVALGLGFFFANYQIIKKRKADD